MIVSDSVGSFHENPLYDTHLLYKWLAKQANVHVQCT